MGWHFTDSVEEYAAAALAVLAPAPAEHTISLTVIENARARAPVPPAPPASELFGWWAGSDGSVTGAISLTPPYELLLGEVPDTAMGPLADALVDMGRRPPGVNGPAATAAQFAAVWTACTGDRAVLRFAQRLYHLPGPVSIHGSLPGRSRTAEAADAPLLSDWFGAFQDELGLPAADPAAQVEDRLSFGGLLLWERDDSTPVAMAGRARTATGVVRIGPVYTPAEHRGQGFGSAVTAAMSEAVQRDTDVTVMLFADLANPTSNGIYQRLGYRPVTDRIVFGFEPGDAPRQ